MMSLLDDPSGREERVRKRAWVLLLAMGAFLLLAGGAEALGQVVSEGPPPKHYAYRNGKVIIGGDQIVSCRDFYPEDEDATGEAKAQAERASQQCEQAGHVTLPGTGGGSSALLAAGVLLVCAGWGLVAIHRSA
jgi:hypothetical protein